LAAVLTVDKPLPDGERWFRVLTNRDHITKDGTLHYQAIKKQFQPSDDGKPWAHELSGRVVSEAGDIKAIIADAEGRIEQICEKYRQRGERVPSKIGFVGVAYRSAEHLRASIGNVIVDVLFTPGDDPAHADTVTYGTASEDDLDSVRAHLVKTLRIIERKEIDRLLGSCE
jgi:hypothetical protein